MFMWVVFLGSPLVMMVMLLAGPVKAITAFQSLREKPLELTVDLFLPRASHRVAIIIITLKSVEINNMER